MGARMKLKTFEGYLQELNGFNKPKIELEQYETPPHIAAVALYTIQSQYDSLEGKSVLDAGCGPGVLSIGAAILGAASVIAVDIDSAALDVFKDNVDDMEVTNIDAVQCDFLDPRLLRFENHFDTVLMNPPFGTKNNAGMDMRFLKRGLELTRDCVYSLHKSSTRAHIEKKVTEWGVEGGVVAELKYNLAATYKFHKQKSRDIAVDLWRLQKS